MARSWVGLTILACLPCMGTLQSTEAYYSYVNCLETEECYESVVVSSKKGGQTRLLSALRHKGRFAVPGHCYRATAIRGQLARDRWQDCVEHVEGDIRTVR